MLVKMITDHGRFVYKVHFEANTQWQVTMEIHLEWDLHITQLWSLNPSLLILLLCLDLGKKLDSEFNEEENKARNGLKSLNHPDEQPNFVNNLSRTIGISILISKPIRASCQKGISETGASTSIVDPTAYVAHTNICTCTFSPSTPTSSTTAQSYRMTFDGTMTLIANLFKWFPKVVSANNNKLWTSSNSGLSSGGEDPGNVGNKSARRQESQTQALSTTNYVSRPIHEDAYDSDVDESPNAAAAFMANLSSTSATNSQVNEVHSNDNEIFDNVNDQMSQEMQQEEHSDFDAENEIDENTISYDQYLLDKEAQRVPTEISADTSDKMSMIAILTDLQTKLDGHAKDNQEICLDNENLKNELLQCKQEICHLDT
ncbi:hypothetical protein Tco_0731485 [Tanacetum coccineum]